MNVFHFLMSLTRVKIFLEKADIYLFVTKWISKWEIEGNWKEEVKGTVTFLNKEIFIDAVKFTQKWWLGRRDLYGLFSAVWQEIKRLYISSSIMHSPLFHGMSLVKGDICKWFN